MTNPTTPAPGDLSARLLEMIADWEAEIKADQLVPEVDRDPHFVNIREHDIARMRAALSALPAAGGADCRHDGALLVVSGHCYCKTCGALTAPQPSAVSFDPASIGPFTAAAALMQATDAAVGAQGDGYVPQLNLRGVLHEALTFVLDHAEKDEDAEKWTLTRELRAHLAASAAPAAGKGVDAVFAELVAADKEYDETYVTDMDCPSSADLERFRRATLRRESALETALTRQPVAGDGWRPIESAPRDGRTVILCHLSSEPFMGRWSERRAWWVDAADSLRDPTHWQPLPAAPADTPADGGEGK